MPIGILTLPFLFPLFRLFSMQQSEGCYSHFSPMAPFALWWKVALWWITAASHRHLGWTSPTASASPPDPLLLPALHTPASGTHPGHSLCLLIPRAGHGLPSAHSELLSKVTFSVRSSLTALMRLPPPAVLLSVLLSSFSIVLSTIHHIIDFTL